jgi:hypothetical protein
MMFREDKILHFDTYTNFTHVLQNKCHGNYINLKQAVNITTIAPEELEMGKDLVRPDSNSYHYS